MRELIDKFMLLRGEVTVANHIPGRLRLRFSPKAVAGLGAGQANELVRALRDAVGVEAVNFNFLARSILIEYEVSRLSPDLWAVLLKGKPAEAEKLLRSLISVPL